MTLEEALRPRYRLLNGGRSSEVGRIITYTRRRETPLQDYLCSTPRGHPPADEDGVRGNPGLDADDGGIPSLLPPTRAGMGLSHPAQRTFRSRSPGAKRRRTPKPKTSDKHPLALCQGLYCDGVRPIVSTSSPAADSESCDYPRKGAVPTRGSGQKGAVPLGEGSGLKPPRHRRPLSALLERHLCLETSLSPECGDRRARPGRRKTL